jgi:uracil-DNA glycosylase
MPQFKRSLMVGKSCFTLGNLHIKGLKIDRSKHLVLESGHPSPMSANQENGLGNKHFSKTNSYLKANGEKD